MQPAGHAHGGEEESGFAQARVAPATERERAALLRVSKALHHTKEIAALCKDTLEPAIFRQAYLVLRRSCR